MKIDKDATVMEVRTAIVELLEEWLSASQERVIMFAAGDKNPQSDGQDGLAMYLGGPADMIGVTTAAITANIPPPAKLALVMSLQNKEHIETFKSMSTTELTDDFDGMDKVVFGVGDGHIH